MKTTYTAFFDFNGVNSIAPMGSNKERAFKEAMRIAEIYWKDGDSFKFYIINDNDNRAKFDGGINEEGKRLKLKCNYTFYYNKTNAQ